MNSTALGFKRFGFATEDGYRKFQALVAHEFFHLWNVKRIRPDALGPFDYTKENYTRLLWVAEGITEYYGQLMVRRAGLISDQVYLEHLDKQIQDFQETPGRKVMSAEEAKTYGLIDDVYVGKANDAVLPKAEEAAAPTAISEPVRVRS